MFKGILLKVSNKYRSIKKVYETGKTVILDEYFKDTKIKSGNEINKQPHRCDVINFLIENVKKENTIYLEIGVRDPTENFDKINSNIKYSVDPGIEFIENPVDFKLTSDDFFSKLKSGDVLKRNIKFDIIFIDGLHLADQVERDIKNALNFISDDGFIVLHDCNPPTEFHARESYYFINSPASGLWNGTTWKAFFKYRKEKDFFSCCIDTDWGIGIISKNKNIGNHSLVENPYFEFSVFNKNRKDSLNLISFDEFKNNFF
jgi:hypothetical protein